MNLLMKRLCRVCVIAVFSLGVLSNTAKAQSPSPGSAGEGVGPVNAMCPVMIDEPIDPRFTAEHNGVTIGLCCRKCLTKFEADPESYLANIPELLAVALHEPAGQGDANVHEDQHADHDHEPEVAEGADHDGGDHPHPEETNTSASSSHDDEHDHATDHGSSPNLVSWIGKLHPPATHLPIGLLIGAAIAEALLILTHRDLFRHASAFCVGLAVLGAVTAATLGWFNGGFVLVDDDWVQLTHRWLGTGTALLTLATGALLLRVSRPTAEPVSRTAFRVVLFVTAGLVGVTGFFGGALVYGLNHYAW